LPAITPGDTLRGELADGDSIVAGSREDRWALDLAAGRRVYLELRADSFDAELRVRGPNGLLVAANHDALGRDAALAFRAAASGSHTAVVRSAGPHPARGSYRLLAVALPESAAGPGVIPTLAVGDSVVGVLEFGDSLTEPARGTQPDPLRGLVDYYLLRADSSGWVAIELRSTHFDAYLAAGDSAGWSGPHDDDGAGGTDARLVWQVDAGRHYSVAAASFGADRAPGAYFLTVRRTAAPRAASREPEGWNGRVRPLALAAPEVRVCHGKPMAHAAAYDRARRQVHPMRVVSGTLTAGDGDTAAADPSAVELVLCMERTSVVLQVCRYNGPSITRYRYRWTARLLEARTARALAEERVQGDAPRQCGFSEPWNLTVLGGSHEWYGAALTDIRPRLERWFQHEAADSAMPALPRRSATAAGARTAGGKREPGAPRPK
jgi:hypothetical protein